MRFLIVIASLLLCSSISAQTSLPDLCLKRTHPIGGKDTFTYFWSQSADKWRIDPLIMHSASNSVCSPGDACFIGHLELMYVVPDSSTTPPTKATLTRYPRGLSKPEIIPLTIESNGKYLKGTGSDYDIFILFRGNQGCKVALGANNDAYAQNSTCNFYSVETYPRAITASAWTRYRPDNASWVGTTDCKNAGASYQPGGGGGHDPPP